MGERAAQPLRVGEAVAETLLERGYLGRAFHCSLWKKRLARQVQK